MNKLLIVVIVIGIITGISIGTVMTHKTNQTKKKYEVIQAQEKKQFPTTEPTLAPAIPLAISIPKIKVNAAVESVGMDALGRMDVPKNADDTAWYRPGYRPGMNGSAVIDGHLDRVTGAPAVFWNLKLLKNGDQIIVTENNGKTYTFVVDKIVKYPYNNFPIKLVFGATQTPMLNLITCNGVWDKDSKNYSDRLVVYSKIVTKN